MSGHSKWSSIRHQKGIKDAKRGKVFTKLGSNITLATRESGPDQESNFRLRLAIDKAKAANMPKENIERAISRALPGSGSELVEVTYEGFGPGGVAILIKVFTDNKNRTVSEIRNIFGSFGGKLAGVGSVIHQFNQRGVITLNEGNLDDLELLAIDLGASDTERDEDKLIIYCGPVDLHKMKIGIEEKGAKILDADLSFKPQNLIYIKEVEMAKKVLEMMDALDEVDDVVKTWSNFDIDNKILKKLA